MFRLASRSQSMVRLCSNERSTSFSLGGAAIRPYSSKKTDVRNRPQFDLQEKEAWTTPKQDDTVKLTVSSTVSGDGHSAGGVCRILPRGDLVFAYVELYTPQSLEAYRQELILGARAYCG